MQPRDSTISYRLSLVRQELREIKGQMKQLMIMHIGAPRYQGDNELLTYPDHLRKTLIVVRKLGQATAQEVSNFTHRARAVESAYLNQLVLHRVVFKTRQHRQCVFTVQSQV